MSMRRGKCFSQKRGDNSTKYLHKGSASTTCDKGSVQACKLLATDANSYRRKFSNFHCQSLYSKYYISTIIAYADQFILMVAMETRGNPSIFKHFPWGIY